MSESQNKTVTFIQYDIPPLKSGEYTVTVAQTVNQISPNSFTTSKRFAVVGERFTLDAGDIQCVFPPNLANGEYSGVLPQVVFNRRTLPWERTAVESEVDAPWLAVLLFNENEVPTPTKRTAKELIPLGEKITVEGSTVTGIGALPNTYLSYPGMNPLDYGELPDQDCLTIDIPLTLFNSIVPSAADLPYLAQIREVDTTNTVDNSVSTIQYAVVMGNRVGKDNVKGCAFLVSLENMGAYLPDADGKQSTNIPSGTTFVRLVTYHNWSFIANTMGETFQALLEHLNKAPNGVQGFSSLQFPFEGTPPTATRVELALNHQANGALSDDDASVLVTNAFSMGYVPMNHHLRHAGSTVSWYRGPLVPYPVATEIPAPDPDSTLISCPDAANRYNPQTGMFDISYGAAWQLGQLLALQNSAYATALYNWKKTLAKNDIIQEEHTLIDQALTSRGVFGSLVKTRTAMLGRKLDANAPPDIVVEWIAGLKLLNGIPFQYLVPDERMLPPESLRFFYFDANWINALVNGAFSIGRATQGEITQDAESLRRVSAMATVATRSRRRNPRPMTIYANSSGVTTGFLLRSQVVSGWPGLNVEGYSDTGGTAEVYKLRMQRLSNDVLLCLFDDQVAMVSIHEPPEQLHSGVEGAPGAYTTTLRAVTGPTPGKQFLSDPMGGSPTADVPSRADKQTLKVMTAAGDILTKLNNDFKQGITSFTSAEFALEMVKGVVKVEFQQES